MTAVEILQAMSDDGELIIEVLSYLDAGMYDDWDCGLFEGITEYGFGVPELRIAAVTAYRMAEYQSMQATMEWKPEQADGYWRIVGNNDAADMLAVEVGTPVKFRTKREAQQWINLSLKSHLQKEE